jgi:asparagine synthetase B (glutamine-hydrolysing)
MSEKDYLLIRDEPHIMFAEGDAEDEPTVEQVKKLIRERGYQAFNISINYDSMMGFWRYCADIAEISND